MTRLPLSNSATSIIPSRKRKYSFNELSKKQPTQTNEVTKNRKPNPYANGLPTRQTPLDNLRKKEKKFKKICSYNKNKRSKHSSNVPAISVEFCNPISRQCKKFCSDKSFSIKKKKQRTADVEIEKKTNKTSVEKQIRSRTPRIREDSSIFSSMFGDKPSKKAKYDKVPAAVVAKYFEKDTCKAKPPLIKELSTHEAKSSLKIDKNRLIESTNKEKCSSLKKISNENCNSVLKMKISIPRKNSKINKISKEKETALDSDNVITDVIKNASVHQKNVSTLVAQSPLLRCKNNLNGDTSKDGQQNLMEPSNKKPAIKIKLTKKLESDSWLVDIHNAPEENTFGNSNNIEISKEVSKKNHEHSDVGANLEEALEVNNALKRKLDFTNMYSDCDSPVETESFGQFGYHIFFSSFFFGEVH